MAIAKDPSSVSLDTSLISKTPNPCPEFDIAHPIKRRMRILHLVASALWIGLTIPILILNLQNHIIGPGFKCLTSDCTHQGRGVEQEQVRQEIYHMDSNMTGVMQLVAKALEMWFLFIACNLVYNLMIHFARRKTLPIQHLFIHESLVDATAFFRSSFWTAARHVSWTRRTTVGFYLFLVLVLLLCIEVNLMGPATAVLLLPTRGTATVGKLDSREFVRLRSEEPPVMQKVSEAGDGLPCSIHSISASPSYNFTVRALAEKMPSTGPLVFESWNNRALVSVNKLQHHVWIPSSQMLQRLEVDVLALEPGETIVSDNEAISRDVIATYRSSLDRSIERKGPVLGLSADCSVSNISVVNVGRDRFIRCYRSPVVKYPPDVRTLFNHTTLSQLGLLDDENNMTQCVRMGTGWGDRARNDYSQFFIKQGVDSALSGDSSSASVNIYSATGAVFLNSSTLHCLLPGAPTCDWDAMFREPAESLLLDFSRAQQIIDYDYPPTFSQNGSTYSEGSYTDMLSCRAFVSMKLDTYTYQAVDNIANNTRLGTNDDQEASIYVHSGWILAAAGVNNSGELSGDENIFAKIISDSFFFALDQHNSHPADIVTVSDSWSKSAFNLFNPQHAALTSTALTLINYDERIINRLGSSVNRAHLLEGRINATVLKYGLYTRTSKLGFVVATIGCVVALVSFALALGWYYGYCERPGAAKMFVKGLAQTPPEGFEDGKNNSLAGLHFSVTRK